MLFVGKERKMENRVGNEMGYSGGGHGRLAKILNRTIPVRR